MSSDVVGQPGVFAKMVDKARRWRRSLTGKDKDGQKPQSRPRFTTSSPGTPPPPLQQASSSILFQFSDTASNSSPTQHTPTRPPSLHAGTSPRASSQRQAPVNGAACADAVQAAGSPRSAPAPRTAAAHQSAQPSSSPRSARQAAALAALPPQYGAGLHAALHAHAPSARTNIAAAVAAIARGNSSGASPRATAAGHPAFTATRDNAVATQPPQQRHSGHDPAAQAGGGTAAVPAGPAAIVCNTAQVGAATEGPLNSPRRGREAGAVDCPRRAPPQALQAGAPPPSRPVLLQLGRRGSASGYDSRAWHRRALGSPERLLHGGGGGGSGEQGLPSDPEGPQAFAPRARRLSEFGRAQDLAPMFDGVCGQLRPAEDLDLDVRIEDIRFCRVLGKGGQGVVRHAVWKGRDVAVKELLDTAAGGAEQPAAGARGNAYSAGVKAFLQELALHSNVRHENIVACYAACLKPPKLLIIQELMCCSLHDYIYHPDAERDLLLMLGLMRDVANGVAAIHQRKIIHRDLKPANVLVNEAGRAKIGDLGLARHNLRSKLVTASVEAGTTAYLAPECFDSAVIGLTDKMDVYSIGIMFCEMMTRQQPWKGTAEIMIAYRTLVKAERPPLPQPGDGCPKRLVRLIQRCWSAQPKDRPTAADAADDLALIISQEEMRREQAAGAAAAAGGRESRAPSFVV